MENNIDIVDYIANRYADAVAAKIDELLRQFERPQLNIYRPDEDAS